MFKKLLSVLILGSVICFFSGGCVTNAVTGESEFNLFGGDVENDVRLGKAWAPELEKEFGGAFEDEHIQSYVSPKELKIIDKIARDSLRSRSDTVRLLLADALKTYAKDFNLKL